MEQIAAIKKRETECDASRAKYADVRYLEQDQVCISSGRA